MLTPHATERPTKQGIARTIILAMPRPQREATKNELNQEVPGVKVTLAAKSDYARLTRRLCPYAISASS